MAHFPKNDDYLCLCTRFHLAPVMLILTVFVSFAGVCEFSDLSHTRGSAMHIRCFIQLLQSTWGVWPVNHTQQGFNSHSASNCSETIGFFNPPPLLPLNKRAVWEFTSIYRSAGFSELCRGACTHSEVWRHALSLFTRAKIACDAMLMCSYIFCL